MVPAKIWLHPDGPHDNRLSILLGAGTTHDLLVQHRNMKEAGRLRSGVGRQATAIEHVRNCLPPTRFRLTIKHTAHQFLVPPRVAGESRTKIRVRHQQATEPIITSRDEIAGKT